MNYDDWIQRTRQFLRSLLNLPYPFTSSDSIEPPVSGDFDLDYVNGSTCTLPPEIRAFLLTGSQRCAWSYSWKPRDKNLARLQQLLPGATEIGGGGDLCQKAYYYLADGLQSDIPGWPGKPLEPPGYVTLMPGAGDARIVLEKRGPLHPAGRVAFWPAGEAFPSKVLADSFEEFLERWERMFYLRIDDQLLSHAFDPELGKLNPESPPVTALCQLLREATANSP